MKTEIVRARINSDLKKSVEKLLDDLGMSTSEAIRIYFKQIELEKGLPFEIKLPSEETIKTFEKTDRGEELTYCKDVDDMFDKLGI
jgi:DNA-damage-inducible protein J